MPVFTLPHCGSGRRFGTAFNQYQLSRHLFFTVGDLEFFRDLHDATKVGEDVPVEKIAATKFPYEKGPFGGTTSVADKDSERSFLLFEMAEHLTNRSTPRDTPMYEAQLAMVECLLLREDTDPCRVMTNREVSSSYGGRSAWQYATEGKRTNGIDWNIPNPDLAALMRKHKRSAIQHWDERHPEVVSTVRPVVFRYGAISETLETSEGVKEERRTRFSIP